MRWRNHKAVTLCVVYVATGNLLSSILAALGSILPDILEFNGAIKHRTLTHCPWIWMVGAAISWVLYMQSGFISIGLYITFFVICGALLHLIEDALSYGGIPVLGPFGKRIGCGVYVTQTIGEEFTVIAIIIVMALLAWKQGMLDLDYLTNQIHGLVLLVQVGL